jgi:hypothetical protein
MTAAAGIVAKEFGPTVGGLLLAFPAIFPAGATLVDKYEKEKKVRAGFQPGIAASTPLHWMPVVQRMGAVGLMIFALLAFKLLSGDLPAAVALLSSTLALV